MVTRCSVASHIPAFKDPGDGEDDSDKADNIEISVPSDARCLIIRGDADWTWDYALYLTHDPKTKTTFVLVVGLTAVEIDLVRSYMYSLANNASHTSTIIDEAPLQTHRLLLPILLLDLAIDDTASLLKIRAKLLSQIQQQTGMDRFNSLRNTTFGKRSSGVHERHWERQELDLDGIMLRLTCLNDWVAAQRGFVALQGRVVDVVTGMLDGKKTVKGGEEDTMAPTPYAANSFRERLAFIQESLVAAEQKCVYLERSIGAQVQTVSATNFSISCCCYSCACANSYFADILPNRPKR